MFGVTFLKNISQLPIFNVYILLVVGLCKDPLLRGPQTAAPADLARTRIFDNKALDRSNPLTR